MFPKQTKFRWYQLGKKYYNNNVKYKINKTLNQTKIVSLFIQTGVLYSSQDC